MILITAPVTVFVQGPDLAYLKPLLESIMTTQAELAAQLAAVGTQLTKVAQEITDKMSQLQAAIETAGTVTPEVTAALDAVKGVVQALDDIVPDAAPV